MPVSVFIGGDKVRILKFIVDGQEIKNDPNCDFNGLVPGTDGYLLAEFSFSKEWKKAAKVVGFWDGDDIECPPRLLKDGKSCVIPAEALKSKRFKIQIIGKTSDSRLTTQRIEVCQNGGN